MKTVIGIDLGGTNIRLGMVNEKSELLCSRRYRTDEVFKDKAPSPAISDLVREMALERPEDELLAVSIGFPSTVSKDRQIVLSTPNIEAIPDNYEAVKELQELLGVRVFAERDVNDLLLYDMYVRGLSYNENIVFVYFGTGLGNAALINGKLLTGKNGVAMELGHIPIPGNEMVCNCGNKGCLETICSGAVLARLQKEYFPETFIGDLFTRHKDAQVMRDFVDLMGMTVAIEVNLFDPDHILLGGGLIQMKDFPFADLNDSIHRHTRKPYPEKALDILYSNGDQDSGIIGAAINAWKAIG